MHNTHLLGRAGQLSQVYFTHSAPIWLRAISDCQQTMAAIARILYVTSHSLQHERKNGNCRDERYISWYKCSWQVDTTIVPNPILYFYFVENVEILVIWNAIREFVTEKRIQLLWNAATPGPAAHAWSHFCFLSSRDVVWPISTHNLSCAALHNVWFDSFVALLLKSNVACCDLSLVRCRCV